MAARDLGTEWLASWKPTKRTEIGDRTVRGLRVRGGPSGVVTFWTYEREPDLATGKLRRVGVNLGRWGEVAGPGLITLTAARAAVMARREKKRQAPRIGGTVEALAQAYRRGQLAEQERGDEAFAIVTTHILKAQPDPKRSAFGEWPASSVTRADLSALVRLAKERRTVDKRHLGGPGAARVVLRHLVSIFAHAVEEGLLDASPAAGMKQRTFKIRATGRDRYLNADEIKALFAALDLTALLDGTAKPIRLSPSVRLATAALLYTGVRTGSLLAARWAAVDMEGASWVIPVSDLKLTKEARMRARPFTVPLCATAAAIFRRLKEEAGDSPWVVASPKKRKSDEAPRRVEGKALVRALRRLQSSGRLSLEPPATVHDLRRSWRTWAGELGVVAEVAEKAMGHVSALQRQGFSAAADIYARGDRFDARREAMEMVGAAFDRIRLGLTARVTPIASVRKAP
jgi:integrase